MSTLAAQVGIDIPLIKNQLNQLKALHDAGTLTDQAYTDARSALERRLLDWVLRDAPNEFSAQSSLSDPADAATELVSLGSEATAGNAPPTKSSHRALFVGVGLLALAALAGGAYLWAGRAPIAAARTISGGAMVSPSSDMTATDKAPHTANVDDISVMAERLAARLKTQPNDAQGWAILARSYSVLGNQPDAIKAYEKAVVLLPNDSALLADYAEAVALASKNSAASVAGIVPKSLDLPKPAASAAGATVSGTVTLSAALANKAQPDDTVFIVARPQEGSRMPLAILRKQVKDLPLQFTLDDSMGMSPAVKLSTAGKVVVLARISKSGNAMPEKGDLSGQSAPVSVGVKNLAIEINTPVKP